MVGELRVAAEEQVTALLRNLLLLFRAVPGADVLLVTCLPRYVHSPCCEDTAHLIGRDQTGFKEKIHSDLVSMKKTAESCGPEKPRGRSWKLASILTQSTHRQSFMENWRQDLSPCWKGR